MTSFLIALFFIVQATFLISVPEEDARKIEYWRVMLEEGFSKYNWHPIRQNVKVDRSTDSKTIAVLPEHVPSERRNKRGVRQSIKFAKEMIACADMLDYGRMKPLTIVDIETYQKNTAEKMVVSQKELASMFYTENDCDKFRSASRLSFIIRGAPETAFFIPAFRDQLANHQPLNWINWLISCAAIKRRKQQLSRKMHRPKNADVITLNGDGCLFPIVDRLHPEDIAGFTCLVKDPIENSAEKVKVLAFKELTDADGAECFLYFIRPERDPNMVVEMCRGKGWSDEGSLGWGARPYFDYMTLDEWQQANKAEKSQ